MRLLNQPQSDMSSLSDCCKYVEGSPVLLEGVAITTLTSTGAVGDPYWVTPSKRYAQLYARLHGHKSTMDHILESDAITDIGTCSQQATYRVNDQIGPDETEENRTHTSHETTTVEGANRVTELEQGRSVEVVSLWKRLELTSIIPASDAQSLCVLAWNMASSSEWKMPRLTAMVVSGDTEMKPGDDA